MECNGSVGVARRGIRWGGAAALVMAAGAATLATGTGPAGAAATTLSCGSTVTASVTLTHTLTCQTYGGAALTIGAPGVTLNLGGHVIYSHPFDGTGVYVRDESHVTITNGLIVTAWTGIAAQGVTWLTVSHVSVTASTRPYTDDFGFEVEEVSHATISGNTVTGGTLGFAGSYLYTSTISGNTFDGAGQKGIDVTGLFHSAVSSNAVIHSAGDGIYVGDRVTDGTVSGNRVEYDSGYGVDSQEKVPGVNLDPGTPDGCINVVCIG